VYIYTYIHIYISSSPPAVQAALPGVGATKQTKPDRIPAGAWSLRAADVDTVGGLGVLPADPAMGAAGLCLWGRALTARFEVWLGDMGLLAEAVVEPDGVGTGGGPDPCSARAPRSIPSS